MKHIPSIGILGGVGAIASARFHLDLVTEWARVHGAKTDADFPEILHYSRDLGLGATGIVKPDLTCHHIEMVLHELRDSSVIAIVCNSIVPYLPRRTRLLTPVAACAIALKDVKRAWLLASESTIRDRIYQDAYPHVEWLPHAGTNRLIENSIRGFRPNIGQLGGIMSDDVVVLGCTELSTHPVVNGTQHIISPTDEMIRILCQPYRHESPLPFEARAIAA